MAVYVLITEYLSISSLTLLFLLRPAVSIRVNLPNSVSSLLSIASLVVPATSETINLSSPFVYYIGISLFKISLIFGIEFVMCGFIVEGIKKQLI